MRIAVMGAGAVGGYFGGMLASSGHDDTLIARGPHLTAIQEQGLSATSTRTSARSSALGATRERPGVTARA